MTVIRQFLGLSTWVRILIIFVFFWGLLVFIFASKLNAPLSSDSGYTMKRLNQAISYLEHSKQKNSELKELIDELLRYFLCL